MAVTWGSTWGAMWTPKGQPPGILATPVTVDTLVPEGMAYSIDTGTGKRIVIGIPSRNATEAALIVRRGLADVLAWLGKPVVPLHLELAESHYGLEG